jgi:hypothetical protein
MTDALKPIDHSAQRLQPQHRPERKLLMPRISRLW